MNKQIKNTTIALTCLPLFLISFSTDLRAQLETKIPLPAVSSGAIHIAAQASSAPESVIYYGPQRAETLYDKSGVSVALLAQGNDVQFQVSSPAVIDVTVRVDVDRNGYPNHGIGIAYGITRDGKACVSPIEPENARLTCGNSSSGAQITYFWRAGGRRKFTLVIPSKELSPGSSSARIVLEFRNNATKTRTFFPTGGGTFASALRIEAKDTGVEAHHDSPTGPDEAELQRQRQLEEQQQRIEQWNQQITSLQQQIATSQPQISLLEAEIASNQDQLTADEQKLQQDQSANCSGTGFLFAACASASAALVQIDQTSIDRLGSDIADKQQQIAQLQTTTNTDSVNIASLQNQISSAQQASNLQSSLTSTPSSTSTPESATTNDDINSQQSQDQNTGADAAQNAGVTQQTPESKPQCTELAGDVHLSWNANMFCAQAIQGQLLSAQNLVAVDMMCRYSTGEVFILKGNARYNNCYKTSTRIRLSCIALTDHKGNKCTWNPF